MEWNTPDSELNFRETFYVLWQKKIFIILTTGLCVFLGLFYSHYTRPVYKANVTLMPPLSSDVVPLNETDLVLFNSENLFAIFISVLKAEDSKYEFFKENILPYQGDQLYSEFLKQFKVDYVPGTNNYKISYINADPLLLVNLIEKCISYVNQRAFNEVIKISKKEHERNALLIQQEINLTKEIAKTKIKSQLVVLEEALNIAKSSGIEKPVKDNKLIDSFDPDSNHLSYNGVKKLKALINNLSMRINHDAFIPNLNSLIKRYNFYQNYRLSFQNNILYNLDGIKVPPVIISFSEKEMIITSLLLGLLLSFIMIFIQYHFFKNRELYSWKKEELV